MKINLRHITFLASQMGAPYSPYGPETYDYLKDLENWLQYDKKHLSQYGKDRIVLLQHFKTLKWTNEEVLKFWRKVWFERRKKSVYNQRPIPVRKDNPNLYGEKFMGGGTRRRPRKVRKTAWKRFYKLFPNEKIK